MQLFLLIFGILFVVGFFQLLKDRKKSSVRKSKEFLASFNSVNYFNKAEEFAKQKKFELAVICYSDAIKIFPCSLYFNNRGFARNNLNDNDGAIEDYTTAISYDSLNYVYFINRGKAYSAINLYDLAKVDWQRAVQLGSDDAKELLNLVKKERVDKLDDINNKSLNNFELLEKISVDGLGHCYFDKRKMFIKKDYLEDRCFYSYFKLDYYPEEKDNSKRAQIIRDILREFKEDINQQEIIDLMSTAIQSQNINLNNACLLFIPASTKEATTKRYNKYFKSELSSKLKVANGRDAIYLKNDTESNKSKFDNFVFNNSVYEGKNVLLFDNIRITGNTYIKTLQELMRTGAKNVNGIFLARDTSNDFIQE